MYVLNDCLVLATFSINYGAILDLDRMEISYAEINVRNEFPMLKLVENNFFNHPHSSKNKNFENV